MRHGARLFRTALQVFSLHIMPVSSTYTLGGALGNFVCSSSLDLLSNDLVMGHDCLHPANMLWVIDTGVEEKPATCITLGAKCCCSASAKSTGGYSEYIDSIIRRPLPERERVRLHCHPPIPCTPADSNSHYCNTLQSPILQIAIYLYCRVQLSDCSILKGLG